MRMYSSSCTNKMEHTHILIINGVNLSQLGTREISVYGTISFEAYYADLRERHPDVTFEYFQHDHEGELAQTLANACGYDGIILNAGAYTHTSLVIADAISTTTCPVIEVHLSNIFGRERYRRDSKIASVCWGSICGFGLESYHLAVEAIKHRKKFTSNY